MWKRLKNFVNLITSAKKKSEDVADANNDIEVEEIDPRIQAELDILKILKEEENKEIDRKEVIYNISNYFELLSAIKICNSISQQKHEGINVLAKKVNYRGEGGSPDGQIHLKKLKRIILNFDQSIRLIEPYTMKKENRINMVGKGLRLLMRGNSRNIEGMGKFRGLYIENGRVKIERLNFIECGTYKRTKGGAIYNEKGVVTLKRNYFYKCKARNGGCIYNEINGHLLFKDCSCVKCESLEHGAVAYNKGYVWIKDIIAKTNIAKGSGGAIYNDAKSTLEIDEALFEYNEANIGGALYVDREAICVLGNFKCFKNVAHFGNIFGPQVYQDGELPDYKIKEFLRKIRKNMENDPENGLKDMYVNLHVHLDPGHSAIENIFWQLKDDIPIDKPWPVWTNRHKNFLIQAD
jgi:hypothetical protein